MQGQNIFFQQNQQFQQNQGTYSQQGQYQGQVYQQNWNQPTGIYPGNFQPQPNSNSVIIPQVIQPLNAQPFQINKLLVQNAPYQKPQMTGDLKTIEYVRKQIDTLRDQQVDDEDLGEKYLVLLKPENKQIIYFSIKGDDENEFFKDRFIKGEIRCYDGYPQTKPQIFFSTLSNGYNFVHPNVHPNSALCAPQITEEWKQNTQLLEILNVIFHVVHHPNFNDFPNKILVDLGKGEKQQEYNDAQRQYLLNQRQYMSDIRKI